MRKEESLGYFGGLFTSLGDSAAKGYAIDMFNGTVIDGGVAFRYGFTNRGSAPGGFTSSYGYKYVEAYTATTSISETLSIETRTGVTKPYSVNPSTLVRTEITDGGTALALEAKDAQIIPFFGNAYVLVPGAVKTLYRHAIGTITSFTALQDTSYAPPASSATITATANALGTRGNDTSTDTISETLISTGGITGGIVNTTGSGILTVSANAFNRVGQQRTRIQSIWATAEDWTGIDYVEFKAQAGVIYINFERTNIAPEFTYDGAVWNPIPAADFKEYFNSSSNEVVIVVRIKSLVRTAIKGFRMTIGGATADTISGTQIAFTVSPLYKGGTYLEASALTKRLWDGTLDGNGINYGVRYKITAGPSYSAIAQATISLAQSLGNFGTGSASAAAPLGGKIVLSAPVAVSGGYDAVEFVRLVEGSTTVWKIIGTVSNTGAPQIQDSYEESELTALVTASGISATPITAVPPFTVTGLLCAIRFKSFMIWGFKGVSTNIKMSRVLSENYPNAAEELYNSAVTYDFNDLTQPASYTLSEGGDEPVGITVDDDAIYYLGRYGLYVQAGDFPVMMSPIRTVPGAAPVAGPKAFCIFPPSNNRAGLAYMDNQFNIWFVQASREYNNVVASEPVELSKDVRGFLKSFLYEAQKAEYGYTDASGVILTYTPVDKTLRVILGKREVVFRPRHGQTNERYWEANGYNIGTGVSIQGLTVISGSASRWIRSTGQIDDIAWDSVLKTWITGTNRDGGLAPPSGFFTLGAIELAGVSRLNYVTPVTGTRHDTALTVSAATENRSVFLNAVRVGDFWRFPPSLQGRRIRVKFAFTESFSSMTSCRFEFTPLSKQRTK